MLAPRIFFQMRFALAQYGWLYLCHYLDLGLSQAVGSILGQIAVVAFTAVGHKGRFRLLTRHVLPNGTLLSTPTCANMLPQ